MTAAGKPLRICLVGATGLVGATLIEQAVARSDVRIIAVARREMPLPFGARMEMLVADQEHWAEAIAAASASVLVCALGTTIRKEGGDRDRFRAVDHDLVVASAMAAQAAGIKHMIVVSSAGADPASGTFYLQTKGEMEGAVGRLRLRRVDILRPGLIRGRRAERRPLELMAQLAAPLADLAMRGKYRPFRSVRAETLARAIFALAREKAAGNFVHGCEAIERAARRAP